MLTHCLLRNLFVLLFSFFGFSSRERKPMYSCDIEFSICTYDKTFWLVLEILSFVQCTLSRKIIKIQLKSAKWTKSSCFLPSAIRNSFLRIDSLVGFPVLNKSTKQRIKIYQIPYEMYKIRCTRISGQNTSIHKQWSVWHGLQRKTEIKLDCLFEAKIIKTEAEREREKKHSNQ